jgi:HSP20 family molecular chaperone IbpA
MAADMTETKDSYIVYFELPGVLMKDVSVSIDDSDLLWVHAAHSTEIDDVSDVNFTSSYRRQHASIEKLLKFPNGSVNRDSIIAKLNNGVLSLIVHKSGEKLDAQASDVPEQHPSAAAMSPTAAGVM